MDMGEEAEEQNALDDMGVETDAAEAAKVEAQVRVDFETETRRAAALLKALEDDVTELQNREGSSEAVEAVEAVPGIPGEESADEVLDDDGEIVTEYKSSVPAVEAIPAVEAQPARGGTTTAEIKTAKSALKKGKKKHKSALKDAQKTLDKRLNEIGAGKLDGRVSPSKRGGGLLTKLGSPLKVLALLALSCR